MNAGRSAGQEPIGYLLLSDGSVLAAYAVEHASTWAELVRHLQGQTGERLAKVALEPSGQGRLLDLEREWFHVEPTLERLEAARADLDAPDVPKVEIGTTFMASERCGLCTRRYTVEEPISRPRAEEWPHAFTVKSLSDNTEVPVPICDDCIEARYPASVLKELHSKRRQFERDEPVS